jgi:hypothetical protein
VVLCQSRNLFLSQAFLHRSAMAPLLSKQALIKFGNLESH